ncbi:1-deoxy-D-xylulose-5-phosphate synthase, partial [Bacteroides stercoris]
ITGVDEALLEDLKRDHTLVVTLEDGVLDGGFGEKIARYYGAAGMKVLNYGIRKEFADRYDAGELLRDNRLTAPQIVEDIKKVR